MKSEILFDFYPIMLKKLKAEDNVNILMKYIKGKKPQKDNLIKISFKKGEIETGIEIPEEVVVDLSEKSVLTLWKIGLKRLGLASKK